MSGKQNGSQASLFFIYDLSSKYCAIVCVVYVKV